MNNYFRQKLHVKTKRSFKIRRATIQEITNKQQNLQQLLKLITISDIYTSLRTSYEVYFNFFLLLWEFTLENKTSKTFM
jgi:hypothetical protein